MESMKELIKSISNSNTYNGTITIKQTVMINRMLDHYFPERSDRIDFLCYCFDRYFLSSKNLTCNEASAMISLMYADEWEQSPYFVDFIKEYQHDIKEA